MNLDVFYQINAIPIRTVVTIWPAEKEDVLIHALKFPVELMLYVMSSTTIPYVLVLQDILAMLTMLLWDALKLSVWITLIAQPINNVTRKPTSVSVSLLVAFLLT